MVAIGAGNGSNQCAVMHLPGQFRENFAYLDAVGGGLDGLELPLRGTSRLGIPSVYVAHATSIPEKDYVFGLGGAVLALCGKQLTDWHAQ